MNSAQHFRVLPGFQQINIFGGAIAPQHPVSCTTVVNATFVESSVANSPLALRGMCDYHERDVCQE